MKLILKTSFQKQTPINKKITSYYDHKINLDI